MGFRADKKKGEEEANNKNQKGNWRRRRLLLLLLRRERERERERSSFLPTLIMGFTGETLEAHLGTPGLHFISFLPRGAFLFFFL